MYDTLISVEQFLSLDDPLILDCRFVLSTSPEDLSAGARAFAAGHIPGACYMHLDDDFSSSITLDSGRHPLPDPGLLLAKLKSLGLRSGRQVVLYDDSGAAFAARGWWLLRWLGHAETTVLNGGWSAWLAASGAVETGDPDRTVTDAEANVQVDSDAVVSSDSLQLMLSAKSCLLVDARAPERFRGDVEPLDPVAGHVPGAVNQLFTDNLKDGCFLPPEILRERWQALLGERKPEEVVHMCGSGVTACVNQLAMEAAGLKGSRLYAGSWSEWIRDPARPVATGPA
ncbi:sulfurtransferase [Marinobacterium lutimaris]|uniref:Thiosulfate/3-mercaptopyruvate sulfurtransferase n=1 Tax=Marinobacterium lutimaris TaxID=568106 RepID=A0A1H6C7Z5_9GAMM|nr:sulfurtransferase [Marinobacterium lutimaris]SEG69023.1 thiosulfate/3-mercaptopyruvate sulfurtransferase [Marinobacterium lutimaris]